MVDSAAPVQMAAPPPPAAAAKKPKAPKVKKPGSKPSHPPTSQLVNAAIRALKERSGSSLQAIKKYIAVNNKVDADKLSPFIKKYLRKATASGTLVQTKGKGASGSFKLSTASKVEEKKKPTKKIVAKKAAAKKASGVKKARKPAAKPKAPKIKKAAKPKTKPKAPKPKKLKPKAKVTAAKKASKPAK